MTNIYNNYQLEYDLALRERESERERNKIFNFQLRPTILVSNLSSNNCDEIFQKPSYTSTSASTALNDLINDSKYSDYAASLMKYGSTGDYISTTSTSNESSDNHLTSSTRSNPVVMTSASSGLNLSDHYIKNSDIIEIESTEILSARNLHTKIGV